jgi:hypothetical protein
MEKEKMDKREKVKAEMLATLEEMRRSRETMTVDEMDLKFTLGCLSLQQIEAFERFVKSY